jgi:hypothetical protein
METGKYLALVGVPYGCSADTLVNVQPGGSATRIGLQLATLVTLDGGNAGMFLQESTLDASGQSSDAAAQVNSLGWGVAPISGNPDAGDASSTWMWTQPLSRTVYPGTLNAPPAEQGNVWANSDKVTYCSLPQVAITGAFPQIEHAGPGLTQGSLYISNLNVISEAPAFDSGALGAAAPMNVNANVNIFESIVGRPVFVGGNADGPAPQYFVNDFFGGDVFVQGGAQPTWIVGGTVLGNIQGSNIILDGDTYLQGSNNVLASAAGSLSNMATVGLADAATVNVLGPTTLATANAYDAASVWSNWGGSLGGTINVQGNSRLAYTGAGTTRFSGMVLRLNGQQKACVSNAVLSAACAITLSAAALTAQLDYDAAVEPGCLSAALGPAAGICNMGDSGAGL